MKCPHCGKEFKDPAKVAGGAKSKRKISPEEQAKLQEARRVAREKKKNQKK